MSGNLEVPEETFPNAGLLPIMLSLLSRNQEFQE
jgi:hypothetical protein